MTHTQLPHSAIPRGFCIVLVYPSRPCHYERRRKETGKETVVPLGIISCVTLLYRLASCAHLGKRTLSLPRLLCSVDVVLVVTFPPFCSDRCFYLPCWLALSCIHQAFFFISSMYAPEWTSVIARKCEKTSNLSTHRLKSPVMDATTIPL